ncbi:MAG: hypothetical protein JWR26_3367 [Pedosphaera sp.]|nr:hypothetical protein [Pedosphaera sp.]
MLKKKLLMSMGIVLAVALGFALTHIGRKAGNRLGQPAVAAQVHGEPIQTTALAGQGSPVETPTSDPPKRKHPKPPSVQRRMVLAQLAQTGQFNSDGAGMPAGTAGTAADLAKTNLVSASSLPPVHEPVPGCVEINFGALSGFDFSLGLAEGNADPAQTAAKARAQIPPSIQSLDGKKVVIQGFLLPVRMDEGLAVEFLLMRNQSMCCYGVPPKINEWITVRMTGKGVKAIMDQPIAVVGILHVGPAQENGFLTGIYGMDADRVIGSL